MIAKFRYWDSFNAVMSYSEKTHLADFFRDYELALYGDNNPTLMQFTGLRDSNGRDIYEGDILKTELYPYWNNSFVSRLDNGKYVTEKGDGICDDWEDFHWSSFEVIGNIYETAETEEN